MQLANADLAWVAQTATSSTTDESSPLLFGDVGVLIRLLMLALGAALLVGNVVAMFKPPSTATEAQPLDRKRTLTMALLGGAISVIAIGSLVAS
jgi:hypothetical protein